MTTHAQYLGDSLGRGAEHFQVQTQVYWGDDKALELDSGDASTALQTY